MIDDFDFEATQDDKPIAYIRGHVDDQASVRSANITQIRVEDALQSRGIGSQLICSFEDWCRANNISEIYGWIQSTDFEAARAFYERNGFSVDQNSYGDFEIYKEL
jgi:GNAT superfamily N-acetyltransferase